MSQYVLHGIDDVEVEVEIDMADYDFQVKYEKAFEQMQEEEKALQKTGKNSEITKGYCEMFNHLLDDILGEGVSEKLFLIFLHRHGSGRKCNSLPLIRSCSISFCDFRYRFKVSGIDKSICSITFAVSYYRICPLPCWGIPLTVNSKLIYCDNIYIGICS